MRRPLSLKTPFLQGDDVKEVQRKVGLTGADCDGIYGPGTASRVEEWKFRMGFPANRINNTLGLPGLSMLHGEMPFPADFRRRAEERKGKSALPAKNGVTLPLKPPIPRFSEFAIVEPEGAPDRTGVKHHAGLDWFAPTGAIVRAPVAGRIVEAKPSRGSKGQIFGGTVKIEAADRKVWIFRHVNPSVAVGANVRSGQPVATISRWDDGAEHAHIEIRKTNEGGHKFENMLDPLPFFK
jgi:murein DD-endopeptidase MepM/ murein hydrolase activator NlpD